MVAHFPWVPANSVTAANRSKLACSKNRKGALYKLYVMVGKNHICLDKRVI